MKGISKAAGSDLRKLDMKGISPQALQAVYNRDIQTLQKLPGIVALIARRKERLRRIMDELKNPMSHLKPRKEETPPEEALDEGMGMGMGPAAPGGPMPPSNLLGMFNPEMMQGAPAGAGMPKFSSVKQADEGYESPQEEAAESMDPEVVQELVNTIVEKGEGIDDDDVHMKAEEMGVDPHEAEEEIYRLLAALVGGKDDVIEGGLAAGMPTSDFPQGQIEAGTEVELEHTGNPAVAQVIAKDHLVEGEDYYEPRLEGLEEGMEEDKAEGKIEGVNQDTPKAKKNEEKKEQSVEKVEKSARASAYKFGFMLKVANIGVKPSEFVKAAGEGLLEWAGDKALGAGKLALTAPLVAAPLLGAAAGGGYRLATAPGYESPEDLKVLELLALYRKMTRQAKKRTEKLQALRSNAIDGEEEPVDIEQGEIDGRETDSLGV